MNTSEKSDQPIGPVVDDRTIRTMLLHVMPLPFLLGTISIIDRTNIGYAALQLNEDIGLSDTAFGFGAGILFLGYFLLEVPSNLALSRFGARRWLFRIAITWAIVSAATAFVWNDVSFTIARFLLGAAEAGLFPGVVLYLTTWFPRRHRAKAIGIFMACIPMSTIVGGPISGVLLGADGFLGLRGWQLIFLFEAIPALVLGILTVLLLRDTPDDAPWLSPQERQVLVAELARDATRAESSGSLRLAFAEPRVWLFTVMYFCYACNSYGISFFLPQIVKNFSLSDLQVGLVSAIPYVAGLVSMILVSRHSDTSGERRLHFGIPMLVGGIGLLGTGLTLSYPVLAMILLVVAVSGLMSAVGTFWPRPTALLGGTAAVAGIAVINSFGNIGGFVGPYVFGFLTDLGGGSYVGPLIFLTVLSFLGGGLALAVNKGAHDHTS